MDRRTLLAIILALIVIVVPAILFPPRRPAPGPRRPLPDTAAIRLARESLRVHTVETVPQQGEQRRDIAPRAVTVTGPLYSYQFSTRGARLTGATLKAYRSFAPSDSGPAQLVPPESEFLTYRVVLGRDTLSLADWVFEPSADSLTVGSEGAALEMSARRGAVTVHLRYRFRPDSYLFEVQGSFSGVPGAGLVLIGLGPRLREVEADSVLDIRSYGIVTKARSTASLGFGSLDPGERAELAGPFE